MANRKGNINPIGFTTYIKDYDFIMNPLMSSSGIITPIDCSSIRSKGNKKKDKVIAQSDRRIPDYEPSSDILKLVQSSKWS